MPVDLRIVGLVRSFSGDLSNSKYQARKGNIMREITEEYLEGVVI
jgi:hypothetical protein